MMQEQEECISKHRINYRLLTLHCQGPLSKTNITLEDIRDGISKIVKKCAFKKITNSDSRKIVQIIYVNNSIMETKQWFSRVKMKDFKIKFNGAEHSIKTVILSSKSSDYKSMDPLICEYTRQLNGTDTYNKTPDIIIMCSHPKRFNDGIKLFKTLYSFKMNIRFDITFDEADKLLSTISKKFIKKLNISNGRYDLSQMIDNITFVTASPFTENKFWGICHENEIYFLKNVNFNKEIDIDSMMKNYRSSLDSKWYYHENETNNPLEYIKDVFTEQKYINTHVPHIIFAPAHRYKNKVGVGSHMHTARFFMKKGYTVLLLNGEFKGFKFPDGSPPISIFDYQQKFGIKGELRDVLRVWRQNNMNMNLIITGNDCINRGITFNTNGFNIDYSILSMYHIKNISDLIQFLGRISGHKKYCKRSIMIAPKKLYNIAKMILTNYNDIISTNPEFFNKADFDLKKKLKGTTIPVRVEFLENSHTELLTIMKKNKGTRKKIKVQNFLIKNAHSGRIKLSDNNNDNRFEITERKLKTIRLNDERGLIQKKTNGKNYRFEQFKNAHEKRNRVAQKCDCNEYCIDLTVDNLEDDGEVINKKEIGWITYRFE